MLRVALKMLIGDRAKYMGLVLGVAFTAFLVTLAASYLCGILTLGFALIAENPSADVWVMDPAAESVEPTMNLPTWALARVRSVDGVAYAAPLSLANAEARLPSGNFVPVQIIAVDGATLAGAPTAPAGVAPLALRRDGAVFADPGGTEGKLRAPTSHADRRPHGEPHADRPMRDLSVGDEVAINDHFLGVAGVTSALARFPPRPLFYMTLANARQLLPQECAQITFVMATAAPGVLPSDLAMRIAARTGLRARAAADFKADTVRWTLQNSEDVGDMAAMLAIAACVGLGGTGILLFMFTVGNARHYAILSAIGAPRQLLVRMVLAQAGLCALLGTGLGSGLCALTVEWAAAAGYPVRMMWFNPLAGATAVVLVCLLAAGVCIQPLLRLQPAEAFALR